jgi:hypothetical protein
MHDLFVQTVKQLPLRTLQAEEALALELSGCSNGVRSWSTSQTQSAASVFMRQW